MLNGFERVEQLKRSLLVDNMTLITTNFNTLKQLIIQIYFTSNCRQMDDYT